jgi:hypothetical protein
MKELVAVLGTLAIVGLVVAWRTYHRACLRRQLLDVEARLFALQHKYVGRQGLAYDELEELSDLEHERAELRRELA